MNRDEFRTYKQHSKYEAPFDDALCKASVPHEGRRVGFHQCQRKPTRDGWCWQHHPDAIVKREAEQKRRFEEKLARSPYTIIANLRAQVEQLRAWSVAWKRAAKEHRTNAAQKVERIANAIEVIMDTERFRTRIAELERQREQLLVVLGAVEFVQTNPMLPGKCPWCHSQYVGHFSNCKRQAALAATEPQP